MIIAPGQALGKGFLESEFACRRRAGGRGSVPQELGPWTCPQLSCGVVALHHSHPDSTRKSSGGWGRTRQEHGPITFQRLSCGVATLHHSHPLPLKPENKTGWLGQYAPGTRASDDVPGLQRWPLTCRRLSCGVAALHHSHPSSGAGKLQFRSAAPREVFGHHVRRLVNRSGLSYPLPDHLRRREGSRQWG